MFTTPEKIQLLLYTLEGHLSQYICRGISHDFLGRSEIVKTVLVRLGSKAGMDGLDLAQAGIDLIGLGSGWNRPDWAWLRLEWMDWAGLRLEGVGLEWSGLGWAQAVRS